MSMFNRLKKGSLWWPPSMQAIKNQAVAFCGHWYSELFAKLGKARGCSSHCHNVVSPHISLLMFAILPLAIGWKIALGVVHSFKCQTNRALAHVGKEIWKAFPPSADGNPSSSVVLKVWVRGILTPCNHAGPSGILLRLFWISISVTISLLSIMASARNNLSVAQMRISDGFYFSTITTANASVFSASLPENGFAFSEDEKPSESFTYHGYCWRHKPNRNWIEGSIQQNCKGLALT